MKKNLLSLSLVILPLISSAQITITQSDLPTIGSMWFELNDTTTLQSISVGGANQTWNYSNFNVSRTTFTQFQNIAAAPSSWSSNFPGAQMVSYTPTDSMANYFSSNSTGLYVDGFYNGSLNSQPNTYIFSPKILAVPTPFTYNNTRINTARLTFTVNQGFNIKVASYTHQEFTADAFGTITTPVGTFSNTLRIKRLSYAEDSVYADFGAGYQPLSNSTAHDTIISYDWVKNGSNLLVFSMEEKMNGPVGSGVASSATYYDNTATHLPTFLKPSESVVYPNPSNGSKEVTISLKSKNHELLSIYNVSGELVKTEKLNGRDCIIFDCNILNSGIYIYKISSTDSQEITSGKFTITN